MVEMIESLQLRDGTLPLVLAAVLSVLFLAGGIWASIVDMRSLILPDRFTLPAIAISLVTAPILFEDWVLHMAMGVACFVIFFGLALVKVRGQYAFGMGDAKLYVAGGFALGAAVWVGVIIASLLGVIVSLVETRKLARGSKLDHKIPHGPQIVVGFVVTVALAILF